MLSSPRSRLSRSGVAPDAPPALPISSRLRLRANHATDQRARKRARARHTYTHTQSERKRERKRGRSEPADQRMAERTAAEKTSSAHGGGSPRSASRRSGARGSTLAAALLQQRTHSICLVRCPSPRAQSGSRCCCSPAGGTQPSSSSFVPLGLALLLGSPRVHGRVARPARCQTVDQTSQS